MKIPRLALAMGYIDDDLIVAAEEYKPRRKKWYDRLWLKHGAIAACICIIALVAIPLLLNQNTPPVNDVETKNELTFEEAQNREPFGMYFPSVIADGYQLEDKVHIYDETVMEAVFVNSINNDILVLRIAPQSRYDGVETGKVFYKDKGDNKSSYIYVDCGDYIAYYSSNQYDLNEIDGFKEMVESASFFRN